MRVFGRKTAVVRGSARIAADAAAKSGECFSRQMPAIPANRDQRRAATAGAAGKRVAQAIQRFSKSPGRLR
jgi:hypothetical protein